MSAAEELAEDPWRTIDAGDAQLHVLDAGPVEERPPVLFVPGLTDVADDYRPVLGAFGRRVVVVDLRGRGRSSSPPTGYATEDHVRDLEAVVAAVGVPRVHLATFSRGTAYGLSWAFAHPEQVASVTIGDYQAVELRIEGGRWPDRFVHGTWRGQPVLERITRTALEEIAERSVAREFWDQLGALGVPVQVARGTLPSPGGFTFVDDAAAARYRATVPGVVVHDFESSRHDLFRPDRTRYPALVASFVDAVDATPR
jgi:pimeloyl-ACP methyl ester carboxylesterase